jgi:hypothetical protein
MSLDFYSPTWSRLVNWGKFFENQLPTVKVIDVSTLMILNLNVVERVQETKDRFHHESPLCLLTLVYTERRARIVVVSTVSGLV